MFGELQGYSDSFFVCPSLSLSFSLASTVSTIVKGSFISWPSLNLKVYSDIILTPPTGFQYHHHQERKEEYTFFASAVRRSDCGMTSEKEDQILGSSSSLSLLPLHNLRMVARAPHLTYSFAYPPAVGNSPCFNRREI